MTTEPTVPTEGFSIDSIKELMDGFDPASLLPELDTVFGRVELVCRVIVMIGPALLLLLGLIYLFLSPREANHFIGYRCYFGMGSVDAWRFTQRLAGIVFGGLGLILGLVMLLIVGSFRELALDAMVWRAAKCLAWEAGLALLAHLGVMISAAVLFDKKGYPRRRK